MTAPERRQATDPDVVMIATRDQLEYIAKAIDEVYKRNVLKGKRLVETGLVRYEEGREWLGSVIESYGELEKVASNYNSVDPSRMKGSAGPNTLAGLSLREVCSCLSDLVKRHK